MTDKLGERWSGGIVRETNQTVTVDERALWNALRPTFGKPSLLEVRAVLKKLEKLGFKVVEAA